MMAPFDAICDDDRPGSEAGAWGVVARDLGFLAEHYLRNRRPIESYALLSFLDEAGVADRRMRKMLLVAAIETKRLEVAKRLLLDLAEPDHSLSEEERRILQYYEARVKALEEGEHDV